MYINLKVKTLDSQNYDFNVDEEMTVKQFKEHITETVKIAADLQRLIYCGRVLNDDKPLKEYAVDGKCLHLVQRPPPSSNAPSTSTTSTRNTTTGAGERRMGGMNVEIPNIDNLMMGSFTIPVTAEPSSTLCGNRITVARHMLQCANNIAAFLENPENGLNNQNIDLLAQQTMESTILEVGISAVTDADLPQNEMQSIVQAFQGAVSEAFRQNGINNITVQQHNTAPGVQVVGSIPSTNNNGATASSSITIEFPPNITESSNSSSNSSTEEQATRQPEAARRQQTTSPTVLADVVEMMQNVQQRLGPFVQQYYTMLREDPSYPDDESRERAQQVFNRTSEALHYMAHAQHAISDLMLNLSLPTPRHLCCRPILVEQSAFVSSGISQSINIGSLFGRPAMPRSNNNNTSTPPAAAPAATATNNNNSTSTTTANNDAANQTNAANANSRNDFAANLLSAMGRAASNMNSRNNNNNSSGTAQSTNNSTPAENNNSSEGSTPPSSDNNRNQEGQERYRNFIQSLMNSSASDGVHIINANIAVPVRDSSGTRDRERSRESSQTRSSTNTQPTTSTQTRSTTRPFLTSTTLPSTSIRHGRPIPANFLSSFDRFLPCNSHHIRESQQSSARAERPMSRDSSTVRRERASENRSSTPVRQPQQTVPHVATAPSTAVSQNVEDELNRRFTLFGIELSLRDLNNLSAGFYGAQREELRAFLRERFFAGEITEISVNDGVMKMIQEIEKYLERLEQFSQNDFMACQSIKNYLTASMPRLITTIFEDTENEFGVTFELQLSQFCQQVYMILVKCIGTQNAERYLKEIADMVMTGSLINFSSIIQQYIDNRKHYDFAAIQHYLMPKPKIQQEEKMEVDEEYSADHYADRNVQSDDLASEPLPAITRPEPWHTQFPSNWLPTIARDIQRQQRLTNQTSYSDAYISGMSGKRRKAMQSRKPINSMKQIIQDCVQDSITSTRSLAQTPNQPIGEIVESLTGDVSFMNAFKDEVKETISKRLKDDPDFDESKYPSSSKAFK